MFQLIAETPVIPASLFVTGISMQVRREIIGGEFGAIFKGKLGRKPVALKVFHKTHNNVVSRILLLSHRPLFVNITKQAFCRKALMWRSLNHKFVLPFLGIYEPASVSHLFLVSPYMEKGTLSQWRKKVNRSTDEIEKLVWLSSFGYTSYSLSCLQDIRSGTRDGVHSLRRRGSWRSPRGNLFEAH